MPEVSRFPEGLAIHGERYSVVIQPRSYAKRTPGA